MSNAPLLSSDNESHTAMTNLQSGGTYGYNSAAKAHDKSALSPKGKKGLSISMVRNGLSNTYGKKLKKDRSGAKIHF
jgi:hypothetical protein